MALQGKGFFTNNLLECESGDAATIAQAAQSAGLRFVILKIAEGTQPAGLDPAGKDLLPGVVQALKIAGISPWGWHSLHGTDSEAEARLACERVSSLGLEGYVINAEAAFELPGRESVARQFMASLRPGMKLPIALCSYQFPTFHPDFPWSAFLEGCDLHMPKVFWELAHNAGEQLQPAVLFTRVAPHSRREAAYEICPARRGLYEFGPVRVLSRFPLGLMERSFELGGVEQLIVYPRIGRLTPRWRQSADSGEAVFNSARLQSGSSFETAVLAATGLPLAGFEKDWAQTIRRRYNLVIWLSAGGFWLVVSLGVGVIWWLRRRADRPRRSRIQPGGICRQHSLRCLPYH